MDLLKQVRTQLKPLSRQEIRALAEEEDVACFSLLYDLRDGKYPKAGKDIGYRRLVRISDCLTRRLKNQARVK